MNAVPYIASMCPYGYTLSAYTCLDTPTHTKMIILCRGWHVILTNIEHKP